MDIDSLARSVRLSVGELSIFRNHPSDSRHGYSTWRAALGQKWHKEAEEVSRQQTPGARFEVSLQCDLRHRDWLFQLNGRIDQILPNQKGITLREVKTIRTGLPQPEENLLGQYGHYFAQASIYHKLASLLPEFDKLEIQSELLFIDIEKGAAQIVELDEHSKTLYERQLDTLIPFLEDRRNCRLNLLNVEIKPAFQKLRDGQADILNELKDAQLEAKSILLQAPTGFGKTGIVLENALKCLKEGFYERCIYLTSKSTGQVETIRQIKEMIGDDLRYIQMRNRHEHCIESPKHICTGDERCNNEIGQNWTESDIYPPELFINGTVTTEQAQKIGAETGVCPYAVSKGCLPYAELWIGDSNYVFSPASKSVFQEVQGFDAAKTLLIIDEAHNLPNRTANSLSIELSTTDLLFTIEEMRAHNCPRKLLSVTNELVQWIESLKVGEAINTSDAYTGQDLCEEFAHLLEQSHLNFTAIAPFATKTIWSIPELVNTLSADESQFLNWIPHSGLLRATCLDASQWISDCIAPFGGTIFMSATLEPINTFQSMCGLARKQTATVIGQAAWRENAYEVAVDSRVDTRLKSRSNYYETTARTVVQLIAQSPGVPVVVFFASYNYAENILRYTEIIRPEMRILLQTKGVDLSEQIEFIEQGLLLGDALFLILGSSYAEGIDQLGGRVNTVMVVGPALPEVNLIQKRRILTHSSLSRDEAFRDVYILPAMQKIHQALGRIVRAPNQTAKVLLHDKRFLETQYINELSTEYKPSEVIRREEELNDWLKKGTK